MNARLSPTRTRRSTLALGVLAALLVLIPAAPAAAADVDVIVTFSEQAGQNPEGLAIDTSGNTFVSMSALGQLWKLPAGSTTPEVFGSVSGIVPGQDFGLLGLATDAPGNVYGAVQAANPDTNGVWRFDGSTGEATRLAGSEAIQVANGLAFGRRGTLYVTDSLLGAIWRIPPGGAASVWLQHPLLTGDGSLGLFIGANGIAFRHGVLYVTNTERRTLLAVPVRPNGTAGRPRDRTSFAPGFSPDGIALDVLGNAYVAINLQNTITRVAQDGTQTVVTAGDPLDFPSSVAFGNTKGNRRNLFAVNFSIGELFGVPGGFGPALLRIGVGVPGIPLP
ncbi:MAG TPA: SMP-30/gluconolactonase/LRE family protein [Actinomycetota bacterium]|jgi:sugar lactone lactonase YvrE|nr:SMP-30/gluconolactonase/LRE family protein [Actinomycetota bacterium]